MPVDIGNWHHLNRVLMDERTDNSTQREYDGRWIGDT